MQKKRRRGRVAIGEKQAQKHVENTNIFGA